MEPVNKPSWVAQAQQHINTQKPILMRLLWQASVVTHVTDGYFLLIELLKRVSSLCLKTLSQVMFDRGIPTNIGSDGTIITIFLKK